MAAMLRGDWSRRIAPHLDLTDDAFGVMVADSAYSGSQVRTAIHELGYIPVCHAVSHADRERSRENAAAHDRMCFAIEGKPGWHANGHREIFCVHGTQATKKNFRRKKGGEAVCGLEGHCHLGCGHISITVGEWRIAQNPGRFVRVMPGAEDDTDWKMGNPFTFHDPVSSVYGSDRFGGQEGLHGAMSTRFGILRDKAWYRDIREAKRDVFQVFCIMHSLAMEKRRRAAAAASACSPSMNGAGKPPPLRLAA
jgi:transposase